MGLKRKVRGNGTLAAEALQKKIWFFCASQTVSKVEILLVTNPEKVQLIQPPMRIMGSTLVTFPFIMSVNMLGSVGMKENRKQTHTQSIIFLTEENVVQLCVQ